MEPNISVVITVFNKERYVGRSLESVLRQTHRDIEVIVVDDGSTDGSRKVINSFNGERIRYVYQDHSGLPASSRNKGLVLSRGKYIALLDGDDYWHANKLTRCKEVLDNMPDVSLVCHNIAVMYMEKTLRVTRFGPYDERMYERLLFEGNCLNPSAIMMRREVFSSDGIKFNEAKSLFAIEDYEYWLQMSRRHRFYFIEDVLGYYTLTKCGAFSKDTETTCINMLRLLDMHFSQYGDKGPLIQKKIKKRRAAVMGAAGRIFNDMNRFEDSRRWYLKALKEYPSSFKPYIGIFLALIKRSIVYK